MYLNDEASGVPDAIFNTAEGALTGQTFLFIMISNHTRLLGYFHESHTTDRKSFHKTATAMTVSVAEAERVGLRGLPVRAEALSAITPCAQRVQDAEGAALEKGYAKTRMEKPSSGSDVLASADDIFIRGPSSDQSPIARSILIASCVEYRCESADMIGEVASNMIAASVSVPTTGEQFGM